MTQNRSRLTEHANQSLGSYELALAAVLFGAIGFLIDRRLDTMPAFTIALVILGFIGAGLSIYYRYKEQIARLQAETAELRAAAANRTGNDSGGNADNDSGEDAATGRDRIER